VTDKTSTVARQKVPRDEPDRGRPVMRSTAHRAHASMGAVFESRGAWQVPALYGSEDLENEALRSGLAYADVSGQGKLHLTGALDPLVRLVTPDPVDPKRTAGISGGGLVARPARDWAVVLLPPSREVEILGELEKEAGTTAMATDVTSSLSGFLVAGPLLPELLSRSVTLDQREITPGVCVATSWARIPAILVAGDLNGTAVELYVGSEYGRYAWQALRDMCGRLGGLPVGWTALESAGWRKPPADPVRRS
jgi:glycine cleavage system aminomethyltransferase T